MVATNNKIIFYGAGDQNLRLGFQMVEYSGAGQVEIIVDKDMRKWGKVFWGATICSPDALKNDIIKKNEYTIIITVRTKKLVNQIKLFLDSCGFESVYTIDELAIKGIVNGKCRRLSYITTHLVDHCNLNCARCSHFSPIADHFFLEEDSFERDVKRLSIILNKELHEIELIGGEPLLHPRCYIFPYIVKKYFPNTNVVYITNGLLLKEMDESFYDSCRENDVEIMVTLYPINMDINSIREKLSNEGVRFSIGNTGIESGVEKGFVSYGFRSKPDDKGEIRHSICFDRCIPLQNGMIFSCAAAAYIDILNKRFGTNLPSSMDNGVDIFKVASIFELMEALSKNPPLCNWCGLTDNTKLHPYSISKRSVEEWCER